jgi:hypothetical protein
MTDRFFAPWTGTVPVGPGLWFSSSNPPTPPVGGQIGAAKTYLLLSGSQFRPPPPPAFGSTAFLTDLAEVRHISDARTAEQDRIAKFWDFPVGTITPPGYWNEQAALLATQYHLNERAAAHLFALMNMAGYDAIVASHDAKSTYSHSRSGFRTFHPIRPSARPSRQRWRPFLARRSPRSQHGSTRGG